MRQCDVSLTLKYPPTTLIFYIDVDMAGVDGVDGAISDEGAVDEGAVDKGAMVDEGVIGDQGEISDEGAVGSGE